MKRCILFALCVFCVTAVAQDFVSYRYKIFSECGCTVNMAAIMHKGNKTLLVQVVSEKLMFDDNPVLMLKNDKGEIIQLNGSTLNSKSESSGVLVGSFIIPYTRNVASAIFPITDEQVDFLQNGISKIRLSTLPFTHERDFKKDKVGKRLYSKFKNLQIQENDF